MSTIPHSITANSISVLIDYRMRVIPKSSVNFDAIRAELGKGEKADIGKLKSLVDIPSFIARVTAGRIRVSDDEVYFKSEKVNSYAAQRLLEHLRDGDSIEPLAKLLDKLMDNPNPALRNDLWLWIEQANLPIAGDGDILAFKKVDPEYKSFHKNTDGTYHVHRVGTRVHMPREHCDPNRHSVCSTGLHFCSYGYLHTYEGTSGHVVIVKINPRDITAIPSDASDQKGRCCLYEVVQEIDQEEAKQFFRGNVVSHVGTYDEPEPDEPPVDWDDHEGGYEIGEGAAEPEAVVNASDDGFTIVIGSKRVSRQHLNDTVASLGQRGAAKKLGIPRTSLQDALKRMK
jgi:hypothetical protein